MPAQKKSSSIPSPALVDITSSLFLQEGPNLGHLAATRAGIVAEIRQLAGIWLDLCHVLLEFGEALEYQDLMFWAYRIHWECERG